MSNENEAEVEVEKEVEEVKVEVESEDSYIGSKREEVVEKEKVVEAAKNVDEEKRTGIAHTHALMNLKLNLLEISHRDIEKIEKKRYAIMRDHDGDEAVAIFKDFVFSCLMEEKVKKGLN
jgi:hypothetical protein